VSKGVGGGLNGDPLRYTPRAVCPPTHPPTQPTRPCVRVPWGGRVSFLEIYNDRLIDLLAGSASATAAAGTGSGGADDGFPSAGSVSPRRPFTTTLHPVSMLLSRGDGSGGGDGARSVGTGNPPLHVAEDAKGRVVVRGLSCPIAGSLPDALDLLSVGQANRAIAEHALNKASTRSHCIFTLYVEQPMVVDPKTGKLTPLAAHIQALAAASGGDGGGGEDGEDGEGAGAGVSLDNVKTVLVTSKLHLVDLAGSERIEKSESVAVMAKEATAINKSLTFLEQVVVALTERDRSHVPYRSSKLTHVLKDAFTHGRTRLIAAVWPSSAHVDETMSTMRFAMRMMLVKVRGGGGEGGEGVAGVGSGCVALVDGHRRWPRPRAPRQRCAARAVPWLGHRRLQPLSLRVFVRRWRLGAGVEACHDVVPASRLHLQLHSRACVMSAIGWTVRPPPAPSITPALVLPARKITPSPPPLHPPPPPPPPPGCRPPPSARLRARRCRRRSGSGWWRCTSVRSRSCDRSWRCTTPWSAARASRTRP
jgi:hypothetical protein